MQGSKSSWSGNSQGYQGQNWSWLMRKWRHWIYRVLRLLWQDELQAWGRLGAGLHRTKREGQKAKAKVQEQHDGKFHKLHSQKQERKWQDCGMVSGRKAVCVSHAWLDQERWAGWHS
jgi:hypothetical protein